LRKSGSKALYLAGTIHAGRGEFTRQIDTLLQLADVSAGPGWSEQAEAYLEDVLRAAG